MWSDTANALLSGTFDGTPAEADPSAESEVDLDIEGAEGQADLDPFVGFSGEIGNNSDKEQLAVHFQDSTDEIYYEVGSEDTVWAHFNYAAGEATDVTFGGAAQHTATAGAIVASLLF